MLGLGLVNKLGVAKPFNIVLTLLVMLLLGCHCKRGKEKS